VRRRRTERTGKKELWDVRGVDRGDVESGLLLLDEVPRRSFRESL
jgi:hypothetical protein